MVANCWGTRRIAASAQPANVRTQIEAAMAYQRGLPILVARERGVIVEGMLERTPGCCQLPEFDSVRPEDPFRAIPEWTTLLADWSDRVRRTGRTPGDARPSRRLAHR